MWLRDALIREIVLVLLIKLALIYGLWQAFFSDQRTAAFTDAEVSQGLLGAHWSHSTTKSRGGESE